MAGLPQGLPKTRTQPPRPAPPSTISNTSSTSSNATIVPHVTTPRARTLPLPEGSTVSYEWSGQMDKGSATATVRTNGTGRRHPHWDNPAMVAQDIALLDENTILEGLAWRLNQFLDIQEPYGLITPEIVAACKADPNICGPAIDMLASATLADGDPPVSELPFVHTDSSGKQRANYTVPLTVSTCPEGLKKLFAAWTTTAQQVKQLDQQFHTEIARNICDLDPLMNVLSPQVARIAADCKKMAEEISLRRLFLSRFSEVLLERLRESEGSTLAIFPSSGGPVARLPSVGEVSESDSSSGGSRPASRSSRRSRRGSNSRAQNDRQRKWPVAPGIGEAGGEPSHHSNGLRSRASSTSLRLGPDGVPLEEGTELNGALRSQTHSSAAGINVAASPRSAHIGGSLHPERGPSTNQRNDIYGGISPMTIPAFSGDESIPNFPSDQSFSLPQQLSNPPNSGLAPSSRSDVPTSLRMDAPSSATNAHQYGARLPTLPSLPPQAYSSALSTDGPTYSVPTRSRGPRPLPPRPSRSPKPEELFAQPRSPSAPPPASRPIQLNVGFTVPDEGGSLSYANETMPFQIPSQSPAVFVVPSEIPSSVEVSSSSLDAARQRFATGSTSSSQSLESEFRDMKIGDASNHGGWTRHGHVNRSQPHSSSNPSAMAPVSHPGSGRHPLFELRHTTSADPLIPSWGPSEIHRANTDNSVQYNPRPNAPGSNWVAPSSWNEPVSTESFSAANPFPKESGGGLFSGVKQWVLRHNDGGSLKTTPRSPESGQISSNTGATAYPSPQAQGRSRVFAEPGETRPPPSFQETVGPINTSNALFGSTRQQHVGGTNNSVHNFPPVILNGKPASPGFAETYQNNPIAASAYYGAGPSATRPSVPTLRTDAKLPLPPATPVDVNLTPEVEVIRQTMYSAIADALATPGLRQVMQKDVQRAFFSAVSLANLNVSMSLQSGNDSPNLISMVGREIRLTDLPGAYRTCITELAAIGREARKLSEEDDERAIAYVARGKALPEPRIGRVRKLLERGVGFVGADGRVRGAKEASGGGTGRSREFSNKISALSIEMMKLPAFQEEMLRRLVA